MAKKQIPTHTNPTVRYDVFNVKTFDVQGEERTDWRKLGVAFPHRDGKGFNVELDLLPLDGKLAVRLYEPKDKAEE
jgi:hypothetical protein